MKMSWKRRSTTTKFLSRRPSLGTEGSPWVDHEAGLSFHPACVDPVMVAPRHNGITLFTTSQQLKTAPDAYDDASGACRHRKCISEIQPPNGSDESIGIFAGPTRQGKPDYALLEGRLLRLSASAILNEAAPGHNEVLRCRFSCEWAFTNLPSDAFPQQMRRNALLIG